MDRKGYGFVTFADPKAAMKFLEVREDCTKVGGFVQQAAASATQTRGGRHDLCSTHLHQQQQLQGRAVPHVVSLLLLWRHVVTSGMPVVFCVVCYVCCVM